MTRRRILFVAMQHSIHVARWIELIADGRWDLHVFCVDQGQPNPNLRKATLHMPHAKVRMAAPPLTPRSFFRNLLRVVSTASGRESRSADREGAHSSLENGPKLIDFVYRSDERDEADGGDLGIPIGADRRAPVTHGPGALNAVIDRVQPDLIHSMEFQHCGYLTLAARERRIGPFPGWLATNWGSDIYLFGRQPDHAQRIKSLLAAADLYSCECQRDVELARQFGYVGPDLPVLPNSGGFDIAHLDRLRSPVRPSDRKLIMIKGYHHFAGRAMTSLRVLERFADRLKGFEIVLYSCSAEPRARGLELKAQGVLDIRVIDWATHEEILGHFGRARLYMGISLSDAISTSVLEAMAMGAFPIQTNTSCCDEWFVDGQTGFIVDPEDFEGICDRFERALSDDALVDSAAPINQRTVEERLDLRVLRPRAIDFYERAFRSLEASQA